MKSEGSGVGSSLTFGTSVVFAGGAARGLRQFKSGDAIAPFSDPRSVAGRGGVDAEKEVEYEVAGDKGEFADAMDELRSWRMARSKGGWTPDGGSRPGESPLKIKEGGSAWSESLMASRPGTAPTTFNHRIWSDKVTGNGR